MYKAPVDEIAFTLKHVAGMGEAIGQGVLGDLSEDLVDAILSEAGRFATEEVAPLAEVGDRQGARLENGKVKPARRLGRALPQPDRRRLERTDGARSLWRPGPAAYAERRDARNVEFRRHGLRARADAYDGSDRGARRTRAPTR